MPGVLFELYNLSGDADLVLAARRASDHGALFRRQLRSPAGTPEQIVVRTSAPRCPTCAATGIWGFTTTSRPTLPTPSGPSCPTRNGLLVSAQPLMLASTPLSPPHGLLLSWNSVEGERYIVQYTASIAAPVAWTNIGFVVATTPLTTFEVLPVPSGPAFLPDCPGVRRPSRSSRSSSGPATRCASPGPRYPGYTLQSKLGCLAPGPTPASP